MKKFLLLFATFAFFAGDALADVRLPDTPQPQQSPPSRSIDSRMTIRMSPDAKEARLIVPKSQVRQLRAELEQLDGGGDGGENTRSSLNFTRAQTIASGSFMSLAFVFGGVWLARHRKIDLKDNKALIVGAVLFLSGSLATLVFANVGPPSDARSITSRLFAPAAFQYYGFASGKIKLEISESAGSIELVVPDVKNNTGRSEEE